MKPLVLDARVSVRTLQVISALYADGVSLDILDTTAACSERSQEYRQSVAMSSDVCHQISSDSNPLSTLKHAASLIARTGSRLQTFSEYAG